MNRYQLKIFWMLTIAVIISLYPFFYFVLELERSKLLTLFFITVVLIVAIVAIFSLRGVNDNEVKEKFNFIKKYLVIISCLILLIPIYYLGAYIITQIEKKNYKEKEKLLMHHISDKNWLRNNIVLLNGTITHQELPMGNYDWIESLNGVIQNKSPIDLYSLKVLINIYNGSSLFSQDSIVISDFIDGFEKKKIKTYIIDSEISKVPANFNWNYEFISIEPSRRYIENISYSELSQYLNSDPLSKYRPVEKSSMEDIDWEAWNRELEKKDSLRQKK